MKQTAVEWLQAEIDNKDMGEIPMWIYELIEQAKEMEKEQKKYFFECGRQYQLTGEGTFTEVHNETYKK